MNVIKRTGRIEPLAKKKISDSIKKANDSAEEAERLSVRQIGRIADSVVAKCQDMEDPIQIDVLEDLIEKMLMEAQGYEVAKKYITYRFEKERVRATRMLTEKLTASNVQNQNANVDEFSFSGRAGETADFVMKDHALNNLISKKHVAQHLGNEIYIHDLSHYSIGDHNCLSIPFDELLAKGFEVRQCDVRGAGSINTAMQLVAVIFQLQSLQQFGGVAATHLDISMVPYIRKSFLKHFKDGLKYMENLSDDEIKQIEEELLNQKEEK